MTLTLKFMAAAVCLTGVPCRSARLPLERESLHALVPLPPGWAIPRTTAGLEWNRQLEGLLLLRRHRQPLNRPEGNRLPSYPQAPGPLRRAWWAHSRGCRCLGITLPSGASDILLPLPAHNNPPQGQVRALLASRSFRIDPASLRLEWIGFGCTAKCF